MKVQMFLNKEGKPETNLFASVQLNLWHIERKDKIDAIIVKLQQLSGLNVINEYGHVLHAYFDSEQEAKQALYDIRVLTDCSYEMNIGKFGVTNLIMRGE